MPTSFLLALPAPHIEWMCKLQPQQKQGCGELHSCKQMYLCISCVKPLGGPLCGCCCLPTVMLHDKIAVKPVGFSELPACCLGLFPWWELKCRCKLCVSREGGRIANSLGGVFGVHTCCVSWVPDSASNLLHWHHCMPPNPIQSL